MGYFESFIGVNFWTALFVLLNTTVLYLVLRKFLFVPVMNMIQARQEEIDTMYMEADNAKQGALALEAEYKEKLSQAAVTGERMVKEAMERGHSREEEILRQANEEASAIMAKASADIALEKKKALNDAKDEISDIALALAGKIVGRELNAADQASLVDNFIAELGDNV